MLTLHTFHLLLPLPLLTVFLLPLARPFLRTCPHILLISQVRHGSTWLLDSAERCRYSRVEQVEPGVYGKRVFLDTELWHVQNSSLREISLKDALVYASNMSLKLFPTAFGNGRRVGGLLKEVKSPVVVLRRRLVDAWVSMKEAERNGKWAEVRKIRKVRGVVDVSDEEFVVWERMTNNHFAYVAHLLNELAVPADWLWFEDIVDRRIVTLKKGRCHIANCNFFF